MIRLAISLMMALASTGLILISSAFGSNVTLINFDTAPGGGPIANGTVINTVYAPIGVTFDHVGPGVACGSGPEVYASSNCLTGGPISAPNVVTLCPELTCSDISEDGFGLIRATFDTSPDKVCIDVLPVLSTQKAVLRAYDSGGHLLGSAESSTGTLETICFAGSGIRSVQFSGLASDFAWFDNLSLTFSAVPALPMTFGRLKSMYR